MVFLIIVIELTFISHKNMLSRLEALGELAFQVTKESKFLTSSMDKYIAKYDLSV
jgi:hypothetical protein